MCPEGDERYSGEICEVVDTLYDNGEMKLICKLLTGEEIGLKFGINQDLIKTGVKE